MPHNRKLAAIITCVVGAAAYACSGEPTGLNLVPASLDIVAGHEQSGIVGEELEQPLVARVLNSSGDPIPGQIVNFRVVKGGGSVFAGAAISNAEGLVQERWTLGSSVADSQVVEARAVDASTGAALVFGRFVATAVAGPPANIEKLGGDAQTVTAGETLPEPLVVRVSDTYGNTVPGAPVSWNVGSGGGGVSPASGLTTATGEANASWTLGAEAGPQTVEAAAGANVSATFTATLLPPSALVVTKVAGDDQNAAPGTAVGVKPSVRVTDANGSSRPGVPITFAVGQGGGSVTGANAVSNASGIAEVGGWVLGNQPGTNTLSATITNGASVTFTATAAELLATIHAGNNQTAEPGNAVAVRPAVRVTDAGGAPRAGITVTFAVTRGGGSATGVTTVTDAAGVAAVGGWELGSQPGINTLSASVNNGPSRDFTATAAEVSPDITLSIVSPPGEAVGDTISARVNVTSRLQIASVSVAIAGRVVALSSAAPGVWTGVVSLVGAPRDTMTLVATATDVDGSTAQAVRLLAHDRPPRIVITEPGDNALVSTAVDIDAACDDDDPSGCTLRADLYRAGRTVGPSPSPLRGSLSLSGLAGQKVTIAFTATDSRNQSIYAWRDVWVGSAVFQRLGFKKESAAGAAEGSALDLADSRLLWVSANGATLLVHHLNTPVNDTIVSSFSGSIVRAFLTHTGAVFSATILGSPGGRLYIWRNGSLTTRELSSTSSLAAVGNYIIYTMGGSIDIPRRTYRMDVTNGSELLIASDAGNNNNDVAYNGDVAYWNSSYDIMRYRGSTTSALTSDDDAQRRNVYPRTDGINTVFHARVGTQREIWLSDGTSLTRLAEASNRSLGPDTDYAVNGGWTAFTKDDASGTAQIWTRSPTGALSAVSPSGVTSIIRGLSTDGSVIFDSGADRYFARPGSSPLRLGESGQTILWRNGAFIVLVQNGAFVVTP